MPDARSSRQPGEPVIFFVFKKTAAGWYAAELKGSDATGGDYFGAAVAMSGSTIAVGAYDQAKNAGRASVCV